MIKWIRPSGSEIETGEGKEMEAYAVSQGWKLKKPEYTEHSSHPIDDMESKEEISNYLQGAGVECDMRGSLGKVKAKALAALEE